MKLKLNGEQKSVHSSLQPSSGSSEIRSLYRILSNTNNHSPTAHNNPEQAEQFGLLTSDLNREDLLSSNDDIYCMLNSCIKNRLNIWNKFKLHELFARKKTIDIKGIESSQPGFLNMRKFKAQERIDDFDDHRPFLEIRKAMLRLKFLISGACEAITASTVFEVLILLSIIVNTVALALEDPLAEDQESWMKLLNQILLWIYTVEACLKIGARGFLFPKSAYLRDQWNVLDFIIVSTGWVSLLGEGGLNLKALRTMRILRPLKSITSIQGLRVLIVAIINSLKPLLLSMSVFVFFLSIFAIAGLQLWVGLFRYRCMDLCTGFLAEDLCGSAVCPDSSVCMDSIQDLADECSDMTKCTKGLDNPNFGRMNFDNFYFAFLVVFQCITLEGWHSIMVMAQQVFGSFAILYFVPLVFIGAFLFLNFTLAVIKSSFTTEMDKVRQEDTDIGIVLTRNMKKKMSYKHLNNMNIENNNSINQDLNTVGIQCNSRLMNFKGINRQLQRNIVVKIQESEKHSERSNSQLFSDLVNHQNFSPQRISERLVDGLYPQHAPGRMDSPERINSLNLPVRVDSQIVPERLNSQAIPERINSENFTERMDSQDFLLTVKENIRSLKEDPNFESSLCFAQESNGNQKPGIARMMTEKFNSQYKHSIRSTEYTRDPIRNFRKLEGLITIDDIQGDIKEYKFEISNTFVWTGQSSEDICPPLPLDVTESEVYLFKYVENDFDEMSDHDIQIDVDFPIFNSLSYRCSPEEAFFKVNLSAEETVRNKVMNDLLKKEIHGVWSGFDIDYEIKPDTYHPYNSMKFHLWTSGCRGVLQKATYPVYSLVSHRFFNNFMTSCVVLNTIVLAMDHHGISESMESALDNLNLMFTTIFIAELALKLLGLGAISYFRDPMNYLDATVVFISIIELLFLSGTDSVISAFRTIRIFRTFRVLRVARLFRHFQSMRIIINVLSSSMKSFIYLAMLLLLFIMIFALLGMQIFGGKFDFPEGKPRENFDSFHFAFVTVFQVLSLENWQNVLDSAMRSSAGHFSALYLIFWICIGNFMLLNLFLAILLDSFDQKNEMHDEEQEQNHSRRKSARSSLILFKETMRQQKKEVMKQLELMHESEKEQDSDEENEIGQEIEFLRSKRTLVSIKPLFYKVECQKSYYLFSQSNKLRIFCYRISVSNKFETAIMIVICLSSLKLVWDTYIINEEENSTPVVISYYLDIVFTVIFSLEFFIKSVSVGFLVDQNSYLRESWNVLDLFIVIFSIIELAISNIDIAMIRVLRLLRTLRPLRFVSHNLSMKFVVTALFGSLFAILNVVVVLIIVWLMFAILGMSLFSGKFYSCEISTFDNQTDCESEGYKWQNADSNFDNIFESLLTLFIVSSLEGWPDIMYQGIDAREVGLAPQKNYNMHMAYYFIVFIFVGAFFMVNFFIGVVFMQFNQAKRSEKSGYRLILDKKDVKWIEMQKLIVDSKPQFDVVYKPKNKTRLLIHDLCISNCFEFFVLGIIVLNMLQMAILFDGASEEYIQVLEYSNLVFTGFFVMEAVTKMTGLGLTAYFKSKWNRFDFLVVLASVLDLFLVFFIDSDTSFLSVGPQLARVVRILRVSRLLRIFKSFEPLQEIVTIMATSLPAILNVFSLLFLIFFIYAVLGVFVFYDLEQGEIIDDYTNFSNFGMAMVALLRTSTGEEWNKLMYACAEQKGILIALVYFGSFITVTMFVMLNLFIMVIVQTYEDYKSDPKSALKKFTSYVKKFKKVWAEYSKESGGIRIYYQTLPNFMISLAKEDQKLKIDEGTPKSVLIRMLSTMSIPIDNEGFVYYNDMLFACLKKRFKKRNNQSKLCKKILKKEIAGTRETLDKKRAKMIKNMKLKKQFYLKKKFNRNYISSLLILRPMIRAWHKYCKEVVANRKKSYREERNSENNSGESLS